MNSKFFAYLVLLGITINLFVGTTSLNAQPVVSPLNEAGIFPQKNQSGLYTSGVQLYNQDFPTLSGLASQNFEDIYNMYDCEAFDDFTVPEGKIWVLDQVVVSFSHFNGVYPTTTINVNVRFYEDNGGLPGALKKEFRNITLNAADFWNTGIIPLPSTVVLTKGTKWMSFQANLDYDSYGQIGWAASSTLFGYQAQWINPEGGFGYGTSYMPTTVLNSNYRSFAFALYGAESSAIPFPLLGSIFLFLGAGAVTLFRIRKKQTK